PTTDEGRGRAGVRELADRHNAHAAHGGPGVAYDRARRRRKRNKSQFSKPTPAFRTNPEGDPWPHYAATHREDVSPQRPGRRGGGARQGQGCLALAIPGSQASRSSVSSSQSASRGSPATTSYWNSL